MRRSLILLLVLALICPFSASAAEPEFIALTFEGFPAGGAGRRLLEGLEERDARATFFLWAAPWEQGRQILNGGHEIGLRAPDSLNQLSRRKVAAKLLGAQALLPACRIRFLLTDDSCSDGVRQVAKVRRLSIPDVIHQKSAIPGQVKSGDTLLLTAATAADVTRALTLVDLLQRRGFRLVTASELARLKKTGF